MENTTSYDAIVKAMKQLKRLRKLTGVILVNEGVLLCADTAFSDAQNEAFVRELNAFASLYRNSGLSLSRTLLGFDGGNVLIVSANRFSFSYFFDDASEAAVIEKRANDLLRKFARVLKLDADEQRELTALNLEDYQDRVQEIPSGVPDSVFREVNTSAKGGDSPSGEADSKERWESFRDGCEKLFCKVLGFAQAQRIIQREMTAMGVAKDGYLHPSQFRPFGQKLVQRVRDTTIRKQLENELISLAEQLSS